MDGDIEEVKALVKQTLALVEDTNHQLRKMRRGQRWARFFQIIWWLLILGVSGAAYYYYFAPYVDRLEQLYTQIEGTNAPSPNWSADIQQFFNRFSPQQKSTP